MGKFDELTVFIEKLENDEYGYWTEQKGSGTHEDPYILSHAVLSETVRDLIVTFYHFNDNHPEYDLNNYILYIQEHNLHGPVHDEDQMDEVTVLVMLMCIISGDRFCEGLLLNNLETGHVQNLLKRLKVLGG